MTDDLFEYRQALTAIAYERVTWEAASNHLLRMAGDKFTSGRDEEAALLRSIARTFHERAEASSRRQDRILKEKPKNKS